MHVGHSSQISTCVNSFNSNNSLMRQVQLLDEALGTDREGEITCPNSYHWQAEKLGLKPQWLCF